MKEALISIIIPVYNRQHYIRECLLSCIHQAYRPVEIIIVDDGSTDNTSKLVHEFINEFENEAGISFQFHNQENLGAPAARNLGLTFASGSYIQFLDSDDLLSKFCFNDRVDALLACDVVFGDCLKIDAASKFVREHCYSNYSEHDAISFVAGMSIVTGCLLFKRECFREIKFDPSVQVLQERELCIRLLVAGFNFKYIRRFVYHHRLPGTDNISSGNWVHNNPFRYIHTYKTILQSILRLDGDTIRKSVKAISTDLWRRGRNLLQSGKRSEAKFYFDYAIELNNGVIPKGIWMRIASWFTGYEFIETIYSFNKNLKKRKYNSV